MNLPIIRIEVERMKNTILFALSEQTAKVDSDIKAAVESYCSSAALVRVLNEEVQRVLDEAVKQEIRSFFMGSAVGRQAVREAIIAYLDRQDRLMSGYEETSK
jgi:hypothetical protein